MIFFIHCVSFFFLMEEVVRQYTLCTESFYQAYAAYENLPYPDQHAALQDVLDKITVYKSDLEKLKELSVNLGIGLLPDNIKTTLWINHKQILDIQDDVTRRINNL
mgnify:FL=1